MCPSNSFVASVALSGQLAVLPEKEDCTFRATAGSSAANCTNGCVGRMCIDGLTRSLTVLANAGVIFIYFDTRQISKSKPDRSSYIEVDI